MNNRAESEGMNLMTEKVVYILFILIFSGMVIGFFIRFQNDVLIYEQTYAKELALLINKAEPGIEMDIDIFDFYHKSNKNNFNGNVVEIDNEKSEVIVRLASGRGYKYSFFNDVEVIWDLDRNKDRLYLKFAGDSERLSSSTGVENVG